MDQDAATDALASDDQRMPRNKLLELLEVKSADQEKRLAEQLMLQTERLHAERAAFEAMRADIREEQLKREQQLQYEFAKRETMLAEREKQIMRRQADLEDRVTRLDAERQALTEAVSKREAQLREIGQQLQEEKERYNEESRKRVERNSKSYVQEALESLAAKEGQFHSISRAWSLFGAGALGAGLVFFLYVTFATVTSLPPHLSWEFIVFSVLKGLVAVVLVAAIARYAYLFSTGYMREALKNADRQHAINFGKFYLESYGAAADWSQVKEAFEHWNITGSNAFMAPEPSFDVTAVDKAVSALERLSKVLPKPKSE